MRDGFDEYLFPLSRRAPWMIYRAAFGWVLFDNPLATLWSALRDEFKRPTLDEIFGSAPGACHAPEPKSSIARLIRAKAKALSWLKI